ncbi:MAG: hypothetical protein P1P82_12575 [Bacteroidales bacterium]|nr:hypothetical protein [Bacteroidales bacterium]MDT8431674.1 hypothetical protein [Bacteroidales bacterium]
MKKLTLLFLLAASVHLVHKAVAQSPHEHCVMFYNVENLFHPSNDSTTAGDDDFTPEGVRRWNFYRYNRKIAAICKVILAANGWEPPDAVCFSEIENREVLDDIIFHPLLLGQQYRPLHRDGPDHRGIDVGIIYRTDRMQCIDTAWLEIRDTEGEPVRTREILAATFRLKTTRDTVVVFANHWTSKYGGAVETEEKRLLQARTLGKYTDGLLQTVRPETHKDILLQAATPEKHHGILLQTRTPGKHSDTPVPAEIPGWQDSTLSGKHSYTLAEAQITAWRDSTTAKPGLSGFNTMHRTGRMQGISVIAGGDLNDLPGSAPVQMLTDVFQLEEVLPGVAPETGTRLRFRSSFSEAQHSVTEVHSVSGVHSVTGVRSVTAGPSPPFASYKFQGNWGSIDHVFVSGRLRAEDCRATVFHHPLLLEKDMKYTGEKPFRTYNGFSYHGGVSDHLPLLLHFVVPHDRDKDRMEDRMEDQ